MSLAIVWFRQDLRCHDNPALAEACANHQLIIPLYIYSPETLGAAQNWWLHHSLVALEQELKKHNLNLCLKQGDALAVIKDLIKNHKIDAVYWNRCYEPAIIQRDKLIKEELKNIGLETTSFNGSLLNEPWTIKNKTGNYFKVFTPYWNECRQHVVLPQIPTLESCASPISIDSDTIDQWNLLPKKPDWAAGFADYWEPGERGALKKLNLFIEHHLHDYKTTRNEPDKPGSSRLSPHLHFGEISPWQIWRAVFEATQQQEIDLSSAEQFLAELGWREFSYYLLYHVPELPKKNFKKEFDGFSWSTNDADLTHWQKGLTGFPIVDAGMRELWHTGYMHNRVRMIVASFLIKDLLIDWRKGADWFYNTLLDADLASNSASWQWVAGSGADSAPYFRIFNPTLQGEKFDPMGNYVRQWVPELAQVPNKWIHKPWDAPSQQLPITLGHEYPQRLVDHAVARTIALQNYQTMKNRSGESE